MTTTVVPPKRVNTRTSSSMYRFTVDQYQRMIESGVLKADDRVELVAGYLVEKVPHNPLHDGTVGRINRRLMRLLPEEWLLRVQSAIVVRDSQPEPDLAIVRGPEETYFTRHPGAQDIALLIEVADSSLLDDRREKGLIYARARIASYWIVNVNERCIEAYSQPIAGRSPRYRHQQDYTDKQSIAFIFDGKEVAHVPVRDLLPTPALK